MDFILLATGALFILLSFIGCFLPVIPGPPLAFASIILLHFSKFGHFTTRLLVILGIVTAVVTILDYIIPAWAVKKFGGSKRGAIGATLGLLAGVIFFPPIGAVVGVIAGAFIGEITGGSGRERAISSALGSFIGFILSTGMKLTACGVMLYIFFEKAISFIK